MQANNEQFMQRMNAVDSKIRAYARFFAFKTPFLENTNSYIWCYAAWMMKNALNHERNLYAKRVVGLEDKKSDVQHCYLTGHIPHPEGEAIRSEVRGIAYQMPEQYQAIFDATVQGYELDEIAKMLGITEYALKWRKHAMIETLKEAWRTPIQERETILRRMDQWPSVLNTTLHSVRVTGSMAHLEYVRQLEPEPTF